VGIINKNKNLIGVYSSIHNSLSPALGFMIIKYEFALVLEGIIWKKPALLALFYTRGSWKVVLLCLMPYYIP
jgi:hypothetical protein